MRAASPGVTLWTHEEVENSSAAPTPCWTRPLAHERTKGRCDVDWKLEVVVVPVRDVDRAKAFYVDKLGFHLDADTQPTETLRVVQMTPPGSACSVTIGPAIMGPDAVPGSGASL